MCTALLSFEPRLPVLLVGVRDELADRAWEPPGPHWPEWPGLIGGRDLQAGGTWLAVSPKDNRASCVLNARGQLAPQASRRSRGVLPLRAASGEPLDRAELGYLDPFHLLTAEPGRALWQSWDGQSLTERLLSPGLHFAVNSGLADDLLPANAAANTGATNGSATSGSAANGGAANGGAANGGAANGGAANGGAANGRAANGGAHELARIAYFLPRLQTAKRPDPQPGQPVPTAWGDWFGLLNGDGLATDDVRALIVRRDLGDGGRIWGTTSVSLVAISPGMLRYDFTGTPGDPSAWYEVRLGAR